MNGACEILSIDPLYVANEGKLGTLRFSRAGFNRNVTQAVLYAGQQFDWSVGSGGYWMLSKSDGEWREARRSGDWIP